MRCKNCGAENDDSRYICEVCGSPLYDENELNAQADQQPAGATPGDAPAPAPRPNPEEEKKLQQKNKQSMIIIIVLCVVLIAVVVGIIIAVASGHHAKETTTVPDTSVSVPVSDDRDYTNNNYATEKPAETTTEKPTETTTKKDTTTKKQTTTTQDSSVRVKVRTLGGGSVTGSGKYEEGDNVTLTATPRDGYDFDGWYMKGELQSTDSTYSFTVGSKDMTLSAKFVETAPEVMPGGTD